MRFLEGWAWHRDHRLDFGGDLDHDSDLSFLDLDDPIHILNDSLFTTEIPLDSQE